MSNWEDPEFEMFAFFELTPDLVCIAGKDGYFRKVNPAVIGKLGYTREELFAKPISSFIHPDDKDLTHRERTKLLKGKALVNFQNRYMTKNGKTVWLEWTSIYIPEKEVVFAIAKDITQGKQREKEIEEKYKKFKSLATHFKSSLEENKKYLAVELHEELAQLASVVKMDIDSVGSSEPDLQESSKNRIGHALAVSDLLINSIRRISFSISPNMLEDLGLDAALEWYCTEFSILNEIPCRFESAYDESCLTNEIRLDFFRICQEALTNIIYHAGAENAGISITENGSNIVLTITDDGKGFNVKDKKETRGLTSIRERVTSINGQLTIQSKPGKGTKISVTIAKP
ncbi:MAG: PAS domain-containing sensor histidine kinase [Bacteroidota bacterium]|nr:PAS domain-containing sensor histidine kinase [Bacteroidota bacterium]